MNRRGFLKGIGLVIGGIALEQAVPLGRVWSFPAKIVPLNIARDLYVPVHPDGLAQWPDRLTVEDLRRARATLLQNMPLIQQCFYNPVLIDQLSDAGLRPDLRAVETVIRREYFALS
jgi:hypothetical protein